MLNDIFHPHGNKRKKNHNDSSIITMTAVSRHCCCQHQIFGCRSIGPQLLQSLQRNTCPSVYLTQVKIIIPRQNVGDKYSSTIRNTRELTGFIHLNFTSLCLPDEGFYAASTFLDYTCYITPLLATFV